MTAEGSDQPVATAHAEKVACPLSPEDLSVLALESETVAGHTCKVVVLGGQVDPTQLRASLAVRLDRAPELCLRIQDIDGTLCWGSAEPDLDAHVVVGECAGLRDDAGLRATVAGLFEQRLDRSQPLWRMDVVPELTGDRSAVIWRIHHALADGTTIMRLASAVLWDEALDREARPGRRRAERPGPPGRPAGGHGSRTIRTFVREAPHPWHRSPFDGHIRARRSVAFATTELHGLRRAAAASEGATVNDAVLTVVAGGLRRWLEAGHGHLGNVRVKVPVSLHGMPAETDADGHRPGNHDSFFCVDLPLGSADPIARLQAIRRATRSRKDGHDAQRLDALMRELGRTSPRLRQFAERALAHPRSFALNVSNVRGPQLPVHVLGRAVQSVHSIAEIRERHALRVAVMSLADTVSFGLCADPTLIADVETLAEHMQAEAAVLADCAAAGAP